MFRPSKKRKPRIVRTSRDDDGDESPDETTVVRAAAKKAKVKARPAVMSFDVETEEAASPTKKKKRKRKGMGFGGAAPSSEQHEDVDVQNDDATAPTLYGKDALEKLKSEQRYKQRDQQVVEDSAPAPSTASPPPDDSKQEPALPSYIPLSGDKHVILTGDEAAEYETKKASEPTIEDMNAEQEEESSAWEAQIASRAGIRTTSPQPTAAPRSKVSSSSSAANLTKLRDQVHSTIQQLQLQTEDVKNAYLRRQVEVSQCQEELNRQEAELQQAGTALEYYQSLREELASWVGALRELRTKVMPLQEALHKVEQAGGKRWMEWQDDVVSILREAGLLDRVLGRQPLEEEVPITTVVDEFGRDVKSQYVLQRDKRVRHRRDIRRKRTVRDEDSDVLVSDGEQTELTERRQALRDALNVAIEDVDEEYTKLSNLIRIFGKWASTYPEEYKQCFASLSLADLASILVQVDLCSTHHPLRWHVDNEDLPWLQDLLSIPTGDADEEDTPAYRIADKILVPVFVEVLDKGAYHIISTKESRSLSAFYQRICSLFPKENPMTVKLNERVVKYLREGLDNIAIPILIPEALKLSMNQTDDIQEAIQYATVGQVRRIQKFVCNIVEFWKLDGIVEPVLDFVASKLLFLLSSIQAQDCGDVVKECFGRVWNVLRATGWLERPEFMLQAAPIRAAASVYGLQS